jgi:hypothetical protein
MHMDRPDKSENIQHNAGAEKLELKTEKCKF